MSDDSLLPRRVILLGEAMRPVWRKLEGQLVRRIVPTVPVHGMAEVVARRLDELQALAQHLADRTDKLMSDVVANESATDGEVYRAVGRFEASVDDLLAGYQGIRNLNACGRDTEARDLLAGVYRHTLVEIREWLGELVETVADPMTVARRRGLSRSGQAELSLNLTLTAAPELAALTRWIEHRSGMSVAIGKGRKKSGIGFWGTVGASLLGWEIGRGLFGDDNCGADGDK